MHRLIFKTLFCVLIYIAVIIFNFSLCIAIADESANSCADLFRRNLSSDPALNEMVQSSENFVPDWDSFHIPNPLSFWSNGVPISTRIIRRVGDRIDNLLMFRSFSQGSKNYPIEMGFVELLDKNGKVLIASEMVKGSYHKIPQLSAAISLVTNQADANPVLRAQVRTLRYRHTHHGIVNPRDPRGSSVNPRIFSEGDLQADASVRSQFNNDPFWRNVDIESWIIYFRPFVRDIPMKALDGGKSSVVFRKGYRLQRR